MNVVEEELNLFSRLKEKVLFLLFTLCSLNLYTIVLELGM